MSSEFHSILRSTPSRIPRDVIDAYLETEYRVGGDTPCVLKVGARSAALEALHRQHGVACSAFVTAWNPYSESLAPAHNAARQLELAQALARRGLVAVPGVGQHPNNGWPGEESYLVLGLPLDEARALGARFGQNAVVWSGEDAVPRLILLR